MANDHLIPLSLDFYQKEDVLEIGQSLLGKILCTRVKGILTAGMIVETESYQGASDRACHAYRGKTPRNAMMYEKGGTAYVYLCYGIHSLFNVVTYQKDVPYAVLVRAIEPLHGIDFMLQRRGQTVCKRALTAGPGALSESLAITRKMNGAKLNSDLLWIADYKSFSPQDIVASPRVGVNYAGSDAKKPWRFRIKNNPWTSLAK
jgi:DNA-3-methyladenine glycosylase